KLLLDPITSVEELIRGVGPAELNGKGRTFCGQMTQVWKRYPFNPAASSAASVDDVNGLFRKPDGALWTLYDPALQKLLVKQGSSYVPSPNGGAVLTPAFVNFFNQAAALSEALYAGNSKDPHFAYSLKALPFVGFTNLGITLVIDGQTLKYTGGQAAPQKFVW